MNQDGNLDLVVTGFDGTIVFCGRGDGTFESSTNFDNGLRVNVTLAESKADGIEDLDRSAEIGVIFISEHQDSEKGGRP